jgi:hypothetical protein
VTAAHATLTFVSAISPKRGGAFSLTYFHYVRQVGSMRNSCRIVGNGLALLERDAFNNAKEKNDAGVAKTSEQCQHVFIYARPLWGGGYNIACGKCGGVYGSSETADPDFPGGV